MKSRILTLAAVLAASVAAPAVATSFKVDKVHSTVVFRVKHMNASYSYGRFNAIAGTFDIDAADPTKSAFDFTIKTDSVDTADPGRDAHLKKADFFNAAQFPNITFKSKSVKAAGKDAFDVTGDLTLHGVTKPISVKIEHTGTSKGMGGATIAGIESKFTIKRSDFGMKGMLNMIGDDVTIMMSAEGGAK
jgi:polyisoprenoid-binding protein YceI